MDKSNPSSSNKRSQAFLWDVLSNVNNDYKLVTEHRLGLGTAAYFFSRYVLQISSANLF
jgi:hypothetical protein